MTTTESKREAARIRAARSRERAKDRRDAEWKSGVVPLRPAPEKDANSTLPVERTSISTPIEPSGKLTLDDVIGLPRESYWVDDHGDRDPASKYSTTTPAYIRPATIF